MAPRKINKNSRFTRRVLVATIGLALSNMAQAGGAECPEGEYGNNGLEPCEPCELGAYQPLTGQSSCLITDPGFFVGEPGAIEQTQCESGFYQSQAGMSTCEKAIPGHFAAGDPPTEQLACEPGSFQNLPGQTTCKVAKPGFFVDRSGAELPDECGFGRYQPEGGKTSCFTADPGFFVNESSATAQTQCSPGYYQPDAGMTRCLDATPGHFSVGVPAVQQFACMPGTFQDLPHQTTCKDASPGFFVDLAASDSQEKCPRGKYQPEGGQISCLTAEAGFFVPESGSTLQEQCTPGYFQPDAGSTSCLEAAAGHFVVGYEAREQFECKTGTYQDLTRQTSCKEAAPGFFVDNSGSSMQQQCTPGSFQPESGKEQCLKADAGHYVPIPQAIEQLRCETGTYQDSAGMSSCVDAAPGFFVADTGATTAAECPAGSLSYGRSAACRSAPAVGPDIVSPKFDSQMGRGGESRISPVLEVGVLTPWSYNVRNASNDMGMSSKLTRLTLNAVKGSQTPDGAIKSTGFTPGTALEEGEDLDLDFTLVANHLGWVNLRLDVGTDESADVGFDGKQFPFDFAVSADGEDVALKILADRPQVALFDSFRVWVDASNPGNTVSETNLLTLQLPTGLSCNWQAIPLGGAAGNAVALNSGQPQKLTLPPRSRVLYEGDCSADGSAVGPMQIAGAIQPDTTVNDQVPANNTDATSIAIGDAKDGGSSVSLTLVSKTDFRLPHSLQHVIYELQNTGSEAIVDGNFRFLFFGAAEFMGGGVPVSDTDGSPAGVAAGAGVAAQASPLAQAVDFQFSLPVGGTLQYAMELRAEFLEAQELQVFATATLPPGWVPESTEGNVVEFTARGGLFKDSFE